MRGHAIITDNRDRWLSVAEIAAHLGVGSTTLDKWITRKRMPAGRGGLLWHFRAGEVDEWIRFGGATEVPGAKEN